MPKWGRLPYEKPASIQFDVPIFICCKHIHTCYHNIVNQIVLMSKLHLLSLLLGLFLSVTSLQSQQTPASGDIFSFLKSSATCSSTGFLRASSSGFLTWELPSVYIGYGDAFTAMIRRADGKLISSPASRFRLLKDSEEYAVYEGNSSSPAMYLSLAFRSAIPSGYYSIQVSLQATSEERFEFVLNRMPRGSSDYEGLPLSFHTLDLSYYRNWKHSQTSSSNLDQTVIKVAAGAAVIGGLLWLGKQILGSSSSTSNSSGSYSSYSQNRSSSPETSRTYNSPNDIPIPQVKSASEWLEGEGTLFGLSRCIVKFSNSRDVEIYIDNGKGSYGHSGFGVVIAGGMLFFNKSIWWYETKADAIAASYVFKYHDKQQRTIGLIKD